MDKFYFITCLVFVLRTTSAQYNNKDECFTPSNDNGICKNLRQCSSLMSVYNKTNKAEADTTLLRNSFCGYDKRDPKVCCPLENESGSYAPIGTILRPTQRPVESNYETVSSSKLPSQSTCGRNNVTHERIVGGRPAELGAWPWMAALGYRNTINSNNNIKWLCGGTLISDQYVLTAAHCTVNLPRSAKLEIVRLGDLDLDPEVDDKAKPIEVPIARILVHERYNARLDFTNDIALLKLDRTVRFNEYIQPICLPILSNLRSKTLEGTAPFVIGWGATEYRGPTSTMLLEIQIPVVKNSECKNIFNDQKSVVIDDRVLCAGVLTGGKDSCQGDSGGPLMWPSGTQYYLVGIVSFGKKCAEPGYPGVYTRVSNFADWIAQTMNRT